MCGASSRSFRGGQPRSGLSRSRAGSGILQRHSLRSQDNPAHAPACLPLPNIATKPPSCSCAAPAAKLCEADFADIWRPNGSSYRVAASYQTTAAQKEYSATLPITPNSQFAEIAENQPELLARHYTDAGLIEKAAGLWGKAGQRSLARSALIEAEAQLTRALAQIEALPTTPALRREQIELQVAFANALIHTRGYGASETKMAFDQARALIERAEALGGAT
jgi:hypothetical protein